MGTMISAAKAGKDVVAYLKEQHLEIKALFIRTLISSGKARRNAFYDLRRLMVVHETAEETIVHPAARRALRSIGDAIVSPRIHEEYEAKVALTKLEQMDMSTLDFETALRTLQHKVLAHAEKEEQEEFSRLGEALDSAHLARMRTFAELVEGVAPTRPHPSVMSPAANVLAGPFAAMVDRTRDIFAGKS
jgi:hypothetical protein